MFAFKLITFVTILVLVSADEESSDNKRGVKRGLDEYGYGLSVGYNDWTQSLKLSPSSHGAWASAKPIPPTAQEISHIVAAAKQAAANVFLAQQQVSAAKEDVLVQQKLIKEKEAHALIAQQKSESAQHILRSEAQNVVFAQQKLAKAKAIAAEQQLKQAIKENEAAIAIQSSAHFAHYEIQKAEQAANLAILKRNNHGNNAGHFIASHQKQFNSPFGSNYGAPSAPAPWTLAAPSHNPYLYTKAPPAPWNSY